MELESEQFLLALLHSCDPINIISHLDCCNRLLTGLSTSALVSFISVLNRVVNIILSK